MKQLRNGKLTCHQNIRTNTFGICLKVYAAEEPFRATAGAGETNESLLNDSWCRAD
jgi:hypothetical protein